MVKKLFKHEFLYYARIMPLVYAIVLGLAVVSRVIQIFENDSIAYAIVNVAAILTYGVSVWAALMFTFVMFIIRFYKNLFTSEGYLTLTLPVTPGQHIGVKVITAVCIDVITTAVLLLSGCIITAGDMLREICIALRYIWQKLYEVMGGHLVALLLELELAMLVASFSGILLYCTFIAIGQLFRKARILASVGAYFAFYLLTQVISTVFSIMFAILVETDLAESIANWIAKNPYTTAHIAMWSGIVFSAVFAVVEFLVIRKIVTRKLNLE